MGAIYKGRTADTSTGHAAVLTVEAGHVEGFLLDQPVALVQLPHQQLTRAEKVDQVILVHGHSLGDITAVQFIKS